MATINSDLQLLICEDEYLLATDMAQQLTAMGANILAIVPSATALEQAITDYPSANAAILDVELSDGEVYRTVPSLEARGLAIVFCSAYPARYCPDQYSHLDWLDKLAPAEDVASALRRALKARSDSHIN